jgi:methionyl-tRNA synthetase
LSYYFMGKDNITFHSQIWPAELLAYAGGGSHGGAPHTYGVLNLPTEVVSSEFLTMEGLKFSSSKKVVIYVRDLLARYQPDAFRYFVAAAGPESQDSDFTWAEFVRRTNDELVAGWATSSTAPRRSSPRTSGRSRPPGRWRKVTSPCSRASRRRSRRWATSSAATGRRPPSARQ